jgi:ubiquitin C-terminal hydrolase
MDYLDITTLREAKQKPVRDDLYFKLLGATTYCTSSTNTCNSCGYTSSPIRAMNLLYDIGTLCRPRVTTASVATATTASTAAPPPLLTINDILIATEVMNDYHCDKCKATSSTRVDKITRMPDVFIISLKKYTQKFNIQLPRQFTIDLTEDGHDIVGLWELVAQVDHSGSSMDSGHYYGTFMRANPQRPTEGVPFAINDSSATPGQFNINANTYLVIYQRQGR